MIYLTFAILASFTISLLVKDNETRGADTEVVLGSNYITASAVGWIILLTQRGTATLTVSKPTLWLSLGGSVLWPAAFYLHMWGIRRYGMSLAGSVARLSLSIPVLFSLLVLGERLSVPTAMGIAGAFVAFALLMPVRASRAGDDRQAAPARPRDRRALWYFPTLLLVFGCVDLWANLFNTWAPGEERYLFVVSVFTGGGVLTWARILASGRRLDRRAVLRGLVLGVPNFFSTYLIIESLRAPALQGHSAIVYAVYSAAGVVLAFLAGALVWREPLTGRNRLGVIVAVAAVALLNLA